MLTLVRYSCAYTLLLSFHFKYQFCIIFVAGDKFQNAQNTFLEKHYKQFEDTDENKLEYTDIHKDYVRKPVICLSFIYGSF